MRVAAIQHDIFWQDPVATTHRLSNMVAAAVAAGARLVVLPERFATGASWDPASFEDEAGPSSTFLEAMAGSHGAWVCGSVAIRTVDGVRNEFRLYGPDGTMHRTSKRQLEAGRERELFSSGSGPSTFTIDDLRVTPLIGDELWAPVEFWNAAVDTDLFILPGAEPESRSAQWGTLLAARAIENHCYVVGANRVGSGGGLTYRGGSAIVDPQGEVLASGHGTETMLFAEVESALVRFTRDRSSLLIEREPVVIDLH